VPLPSIVANPALAAYAEAAKRSVGDSGSDRAATVPSFGDLLADSIGEAVDASRSSESISIQATSGQSDLQDVVEAVNAAEISLQTVVAIRDRVISAYQEILRMPI
jgi:flagellar hook-basal body complex protein FliE